MDRDARAAASSKPLMGHALIFDDDSFDMVAFMEYITYQQMFLMQQLALPDEFPNDGYVEEYSDSNYNFNSLQLTEHSELPSIPAHFVSRSKFVKRMLLSAEDPNTLNEVAIMNPNVLIDSSCDAATIFKSFLIKYWSEVTVRHNFQKFRMIDGQEGVSNGYVFMYLTFNNVSAIVRFFVSNDPQQSYVVSLVIGHP